MAIVINGSGTVTGISVGGLPDGVVDAGTLATNSVDSAELIDGAVDNSHMAAMAASKLTGALPAISGASLTGLSSGLSSASTFRLQADHTTNADITNWGEASGSGYGRLGTAVSESSGVFTFPSTGIWLILAQISFSGVANDQTTCQINVTTNNSSYGSESYATTEDIGGRHNDVVSMFVMVDVTDTSNVKAKLTVSSLNSGSYVKGSSGQNETAAIFIKLGDT